MASEPDVKLEIGHVLFIDTVGYSKLLIDDQRELQQQLNQIVRNTEQFRAAEAAGKLVRLPAGDGMALVFFNDPKAPIECAIEIATALKNHPDIQLRMGIHSGPINEVLDVNERTNVAGAGIDIAQRVMNCGDAGHILLSKRVADDLAPYSRWNPNLHELGECDVKHGRKISLVNFYTDEVGNSQTPQKFSKPEEKSAPLRRRVSSPLLVVVALLALIVLGAVIFRLVGTDRRSSASAVPLLEKSIAVLPFENLSAEKDDAFFADGIQDDVLTSLGKIKDLTVIARASVLPYRGEAAAGKLREIGQTLRVAHILQGSVRHIANRVVVNVQLIDVRNDRQIWTERYERTMTDALSLQGELAVEIARELHATLTPLEQRAVATKPTENPDAYVLYLRGRELEIRFSPSSEDYETAVKLYQQAIDLDATFALARARLSLRLTFLASHFPGKDSARIPKALAEAEEALRLQPNLGEGRLALAYYYFRATSDFDRALAELARAEQLIPNSAEVWNTRAEIYKRQGKFRERIAALQHAEILDPRDTRSLGLSWMTFRAVRNWPEAIRTWDRVKAVVPPEENRYVWGFAYSEFRMSGAIDPLKKVIAEAPIGTPPGELNLARYELAMLERDFPAAERFLRETPAQVFEEWTTDLSGQKLMHEALLTVARGADPAVIERALVRARQAIEKLLADNPTAQALYGTLGLIDAFRGRKEDAIREGRRWVELEDGSMLEKNDAAAALALIYARVGEPDEAIKRIEKLLTVPANLGHDIFSMTQTDLKWRWVWDPLRNDPRFQKILAGPEPKTVY